MKRKAGREKQQDPWKLPDWDSYSDSIVNTNDLYSISDVEEKEEVSGHFSQSPSLIAHEYPFRSNFYHGSTQNKTSPVSQTSSKRNESSSLSSLGSDISFRSLRRPLSAVSQTSMNNLASQQIKITQQLKHVQARFEDLKNKINAEGKENVNKLRNQYEKNMIENFTQTQNDEVERCLLARLEQMKKTLDYVSGSYQIDPTEVENAISLGKNALMPHQFHLELPLLSRKLPVVFPLFDQRNCQEVKKEDQTEIERHLYEMERSCLNHFHEVDKMVRRKEASFQECFQRLQEFYTLQQQKLVNEIIHQFKQKSSKMKKKTRLIDEELQKKKTEVEEIQTELSRSQMEKENLIVQLDTLRNELLKMTEELQNTKKNMEKQQIKIHTYEQDNHALKDEIISLKSMLSQKELEMKKEREEHEITIEEMKCAHKKAVQELESSLKWQLEEHLYGEILPQEINALKEEHKLEVNRLHQRLKKTQKTLSKVETFDKSVCTEEQASVQVVICGTQTEKYHEPIDPSIYQEMKSLQKRCKALEKLLEKKFVNLSEERKQTSKQNQSRMASSLSCPPMKPLFDSTRTTQDDILTPMYDVPKPMLHSFGYVSDVIRQIEACMKLQGTGSISGKSNEDIEEVVEPDTEWRSASKNSDTKSTFSLGDLNDTSSFSSAYGQHRTAYQRLLEEYM